MPIRFPSKNRDTKLSYFQIFIKKMLDRTKSNFDEISKLFPGEYEKIAMYPLSVRNCPQEKQTVLIYFLGGCTYTELAVLRKMATQKSIFLSKCQKNLNFIFF